MQELIEALKLSKPILDKTQEFMTSIFGSSVHEIDNHIADKIRYRRLVNQVKIFNKARILFEKNNLNPRQLNLKALVPLLESSSLEEDELLQDKWANLITNICSTPENGLESKLIKTLSNLSALEAQVLDYIYLKFVNERETIFQKNKDSKYFKYKSIEDVSLSVVTIHFWEIQKRFGLTNEFTKICIDNLVSLGLVRYEEPEIQIENLDKGPVSFDDVGQSASFPDAYASYNQSDDCNMKEYGIYFVTQCKTNKNAT